MGIKDQLFYWQLNKRLKLLKRNKHFINLDSALSAAIIWNCGDRAAFDTLTKELSKRQIKITDMCFSPGSSVGNTANLISKDDFNYWGMPKSENLINFIHREFDLLIDISLNNTNQAQVTRALSKARFKVGWVDNESDYFDFSIDISLQKEPSYLVDQLIHYLNEIKQN